VVPYTEGMIELAYKDSTFNASDSLLLSTGRRQMKIFTHRNKPHQLVPECASINEVSRLFHFNNLQHIAFKIIGEALLKVLQEQLRNTVDDTETHLSQVQHQALMLQGAGGCGKSTVIKAFVVLSQSWGRLEAIATFAKTGTAAVNIDGRTLDSLLFTFRMHGVISEAFKVQYRGITNMTPAVL
jgi:hypothetical protein